jgi:hypothetical protein
MTKEQKNIFIQIDKILWENWNPIGCGVPKDEYQGYTPQIFQLKIQGADIYKIANKLYEFETVNIGVTGDIEHCKSIAERIVKI